MKFRILLFFGLLFSCISYSQRIEVQTGPIVDLKTARSQMGGPKFHFTLFGTVKYSTALFFNTQTKRTYYGAGYSGGNFNFGVFEDYIRFSEMKKLSSETLNEKVDLYAFVTLENKMFLFYGMKYPKQDEVSVYVNEVSADMVLLGSPILIHKFSNLELHGSNILFNLSENKKNILITRILDVKSKEKQKLFCKVIGNSFSEIWSKEIELENEDKNIDLRTAEIDNAGNLYLLTEYSKRKINQPILYSYFWKSKSLKSHNLGPSTGENFGTNLELLKGETPYLVGLNQNEKNITYFIDKVNVVNESLEHLGANPMPADFYKSSQFRVFSTKDWSVMNMVNLDNGSIAASVEARYVQYKNGMPVAYISYNTYVIAFGSDGSLKWSHVVRKKQQFTRETVGHSLISAKNNVMVIFNDHPDNLNKKFEDEKIEGYLGMKSSMAVVHEIDENGKAIKYPLFKDAAIKNYTVNITSLEKIENDFYYVPGIFYKGMLSFEMRNFTLRIK